MVVQSKQSSEASLIPETKEFDLQPKQIEFCQSEADIVVYGGSAGGGKTRALLYEPIGRRLHEIKGFNGVIFRRSYPEITNAGGLWDEASEIYPYASGRGVVGALEYRFPKGTKISFRHLEHPDSVHDYQGAQFCYIGFDELTHFTDRQFWYLLSRNRSVCGVVPYVRATCNPDPGWVKELLSPWVDDAFEGRRAASGEPRWFIRCDGKVTWVDRDTSDAKSLTFIRASVYDNQVLLQKNPEYLANLKALLPVERARLLDGNWNVRQEGLVYPEAFDPQFDVIVEHGPSDYTATEGGMDFGLRNPFVALSGLVDRDDILWVTGCYYQRERTIPDHSDQLPHGVKWWADPAGAQEQAQLRRAGHTVISCVHMATKGATGETKTPLRSGIDQVRHRMRTGRLKIVRPRCLELVRELGLYTYDPEKPDLEEPIKEHDHSPDALRYWVVGRGRQQGKYAAPVLKPVDANDLLSLTNWR